MDTFNLVDQPWIPVVGQKRTSLLEAFSSNSPQGIVGTPIQKIALMKLLQAIAQAAGTPETEDVWDSLTDQELSTQCQRYLREWQHKFDLYGDEPFLQVPSVRPMERVAYGHVLPHISTGNATVVRHAQVETGEVSNADRAVLLITLLSFALGGWPKTRSDDKGKPIKALPGPSTGWKGLLHSQVYGETLLESIRLNVLSKSVVAMSGSKGMYQRGIGVPPWEQMPDNPDSSDAQAAKQTLIGRLIPLSRFCLLAEDGIHYANGVEHQDHREGYADPTVTIIHEKKLRVLYVEPNRRPWRELAALLTLTATGKQKQHPYNCLQLQTGLDRAKRKNTKVFLWSGGMKVTTRSGSYQTVSGTDDYVDSKILILSDSLNNKAHFRLEEELGFLEKMSRVLSTAISQYHKQLKGSKFFDKKTTEHALRIFWNTCEQHAQELLEACWVNDDAQWQCSRSKIRRFFFHAQRVQYDSACAHDTARQFLAWAKCRPSLPRTEKKP